MSSGVYKIRILFLKSPFVWKTQSNIAVYASKFFVFCNVVEGLKEIKFVYFTIPSNIKAFQCKRACLYMESIVK